MEQERNDLLDAIAFFEQMLQTMPDDRVSLEFLGDAYEQTGDVEKAQTAWLQLAREILKTADADHAKGLRMRLEPYRGDAMMAAVADELDALMTEHEARQQAAGAARSAAIQSAPPAPAINLKPAQLRMSAAFEEVNLAWLLHEQGMLDAAEYEKLTVEMTEGGAAIPEVPVSSLLGLHLAHPERTDSAVTLLVQRFSLLPLRLDLFEIPQEIRSLLPPVYVRIRGAFPVSKLGAILSVAVLNPSDTKLQSEVSSLVGSPCTFFLAHPAHLESALAAYPVSEE